MRIYTNETLEKVGKDVELAGWVDARRDHGKLIFIDLRDREGLVQLVFSAKNEGLRSQADALRPEWVISVKGKVSKRPDNMVNADLETGRVEVSVSELEILAESKTPPFPLDSDGYEIEEELRLKYRYLDLRRSRLQKNIRLRSEFVRLVREFLFDMNFTEIETPLLTKTTPEGARDFIVPARLHKGKFFALPQSPQQYKQLLMIAGFERYFQIARAIRDEDLRAERGFEHTQIDMEMSFVEREDIMALNEEMMITIFEAMGATIKEKPFPVFTHKEVMKQFGDDKFDMRTEKEKEANILAFAWVVDFPFFEEDKYMVNGGGWTFSHNPFSAPASAADEKLLLAGKEIEKITSSQFDLICNGYELGGGSIRSNKPGVLKAVLNVIGYDDKAAKKDFGHMIEALEYGAPPHGGIAHGVERAIMILTGEEYLREVQAFPQTGSGRTSVMDAPSEVDKTQLDELGLSIKPKKTKATEGSSSDTSKK